MGSIDMKCTKGRWAKCEVQLRPPRLKQKRKEVRDAGGIWRIWRVSEAEWSIRMTSMTPWFFGPFFPSNMILLFGPLWYDSVITTQSISVNQLSRRRCNSSHHFPSPLGGYGGVDAEIWDDLGLPWFAINFLRFLRWKADKSCVFLVVLGKVMGCNGSTCSSLL